MGDPHGGECHQPQRRLDAVGSALSERDRYLLTCTCGGMRPAAIDGYRSLWRAFDRHLADVDVVADGV
ncbi:hypothetical protein [Nonomuraea typhae]|uniref:Beta-ketoacyl synthase N-terminal domain-containing protein n=1 Tax=Nonomuraea typhae TaxID=2603600 RepID=A0ABW7YWR6_9ACTN